MGRERRDGVVGRAEMEGEGREREKKRGRREKEERRTEIKSRIKKERGAV